MRIHPDLLVNELVTRYPEAMPVLAGAGIDTCCGGGQSLATAAAHAGLSYDQLLVRLERDVTPEHPVMPPACGCQPKQG